MRWWLFRYSAKVSLLLAEVLYGCLYNVFELTLVLRTMELCGCFYKLGGALKGVLGLLERGLGLT